MKLLYFVIIAIMQMRFSQSQNNIEDEKRPYKFAFNIEGYQHRSEEKNERGIIMGEYGFVTGDGVYHLTVYATDENGNFRIVRTKNFYVGLPMEPTTESAAQGLQLNGRSGCSGCLIPPTQSPDGLERKLTSAAKNPSGVKEVSKFPLGINNSNRIKMDPFKVTTEQGGMKPLANARVPKTLNGIQTVTGKGKEQMNIEKMTLDPNTTPLPTNLNDLLYKFNYTLTYHGHNEIGNRGGLKNGSYYFNGRDGFQRNVTYVANEFGFQPNISLVELKGENTPEETSEKELTKLLGNEFRWFYGNNS